MSKLMQRNYNALKILSAQPHQTLSRSLKSAPNDTINAIGETALNLISGNVPLSKKKFKYFKKKRDSLYIIANRKVSLNKRKKAVCQQGGFLISALLSTVLPTVASLIGSAISRN